MIVTRILRQVVNDYRLISTTATFEGGAFVLPLANKHEIVATEFLLSKTFSALDLIFSFTENIKPCAYIRGNQ